LEYRERYERITLRLTLVKYFGGMGDEGNQFRIALKGGFHTNIL
jgi:hypothetical protein